MKQVKGVGLNALLVTVLCLTGCDSNEPPTKPVAVAPVPQAVVEKKSAIKPQPVAVIAPPAPTPKPPAKPMVKPPVVSTVVEPVRLDLDLTLPASTTPAAASPDAAKPWLETSGRLPQLLSDKPSTPSRFQLNGRLVTDQRLDELNLEAVKGAELQIEFKQ